MASIDIERRTPVTSESSSTNKPPLAMPSSSTLPSAHTTPPPPYTTSQKRFLTLLASLSGTLSGLASNIYFPLLPTLSSTLRATPSLLNLTITTYMIMQGLSPTLWGSLSDAYGRRITYLLTLTIFLGACIGLAESNRYYQLLILRCLQSFGSASTIALGAGVVGDVTAREERGGYMGVFQAGVLVPLAMGPVVGGCLSQGLGWRAVFWFLVCYGGAILVMLAIWLPETLVSLRGKEEELWWTRMPMDYLKKRKGGSKSNGTDCRETKKVRLDFLGPLKILFNGEVTSIIAFLSIYYAVWQMTITAMSTLFNETYGLNDIQIGLTFIANGVGCTIGTITTGRILDKDYRRIKDNFTGSHEEFPLERARLRTVWLWSALQCTSTAVFGWTLYAHVPIAVPIICTFFLGWAATSMQSVITTYLVDVFSNRGASATAALNMARCLTGAGATAAVLPIIDAMGVGWTFTLAAAVMFGSLGLVLVQMRCGRIWRRKREEAEKA